MKIIRIFKFLLPCVALILSSELTAQFEFSYDNYAGIYSLLSNPASQVESKYEYGFNGLSLSHWNYSDQGQFQTFETVAQPNGFNSLTFDASADFGKGSVNAFRHNDIVMPSAYLNIGNKMSVGFVARSRFVENFDNINPFLWSGITETLPAVEVDVAINAPSLSYLGHRWKEVGLSIAYQPIESTHHSIVFGVTGKYLLGNGYTQIYAENFTGNYDQQGDLFNLSGNFSISSAFSDLENVVDKTSKAASNTGEGVLENTWNALSDFDSRGTGFGADIGLVYEFRPSSTNRIGRGRNPKRYNKYQVRLGISVLDLGFIQYDEIRRENYSINSANFSGNQLAQTGLQTVLNANTAVSNNPVVLNHQVYLPTRMNINLDVLPLPEKNLYLNFNYVLNLTNTNVDESLAGAVGSQTSWQNAFPERISLTARLEKEKLGIYLPLSYDKVFGFDVATGIRYGSFQLLTNILYTEIATERAPSLQLRYSLQFPYSN